jgi:hypothetical protein
MASIRKKDLSEGAAVKRHLGGTTAEAACHRIGGQQG